MDNSHRARLEKIKKDAFRAVVDPGSATVDERIEHIADGLSVLAQSWRSSHGDSRTIYQSAYNYLYRELEKLDGLHALDAQDELPDAYIERKGE